MQIKAWFKAARSQGWQKAPSPAALVRLICSRQGCRQKITRPLSKPGPVPDPCPCEHVGQFARPVFAEYHRLAIELARRRKALGLSQEDVAAAAGLADGHVNKLEAFHRVPQFPTLQLWAATLGLQIQLRPAALPEATQRAIESRHEPLRETSHSRRTFDERQRQTG